LLDEKVKDLYLIFNPFLESENILTG